MWDLLVLLAVFSIKKRGVDAISSKSSPPLYAPMESEDDTTYEDDEGLKIFKSENDYEWDNEAHEMPSLILQEDTAESLPGEFQRTRFFVPDPAVYKVVGKRSSDRLFPWESVYSLRGKKALANLPWTMGLQSPMLRGKKSTPVLPWTMNLQSPMLRGKKHMQFFPSTINLQRPMLRHKKSAPTLPWKMSLQSPMLRGKKVIPILQWTMDLQSPMLRGKKTKTLMNLPWQMDLKSPMLRGKKSILPQFIPEATIERPFGNKPAILDDTSTLLTRTNIPWSLGYLSPMMRG